VPSIVGTDSQVVQCSGTGTPGFGTPGFQLQVEKSCAKQAETTSAVSAEQAVVASPFDGKGRSSINPVSQFTNDIGTILTATLSNDEAISNIQGLAKGQKYHLLANYFTPPQEYDFPSRYLHQCQRQFKPRYLMDGL